MTNEQKLLTFVRRTCKDRHHYWCSVYEGIAAGGRDRAGSSYTRKAYGIFPRYNVDAAVLQEVEKLDPDALPPFDELRDRLVRAAQTAATPFTADIGNPVHDRAMVEEREWLADQFGHVAPEDLFRQRPLSYRRVLTDQEVDKLRQRLGQRWSIDGGYWYPLRGPQPPSVVAYNLWEIDKASLQQRLKGFFAERDITRLYEIRESGPSYEIEAGAEDLIYDGAEGFWIGSTDDWVIYCSHEQTITLGGAIAEYVAPRL